MSFLWLFVVMMVLGLTVWYLMGKQKPTTGQKPPSEPSLEPPSGTPPV